MNIRFTWIVLFALLMFAGKAQETDPDQLETTGIVYEENEGVNMQRDSEKPSRFDTGLELGTSFSYSPGNFYGPSYYIAPHFSYMATPRLRLSAGIALQQTNLYPLYESTGGNEMLPMTRAFLYARGSYLLSERLVLHGTAYKTVNDVPRRADAMPVYNYDYSGFNVGLDYHINSSISIGVQINMRNGGYYYPGQTGLIPPDAYVPVPGF